MSELHINQGGIHDPDDPLHGLTPLPFVRRDGRCSLPYRVYKGRFDYDGTTTWEVARFRARVEAEAWIESEIAFMEGNGTTFLKPPYTPPSAAEAIAALAAIARGAERKVISDE